MKRSNRFFNLFTLTILLSFTTAAMAQFKPKYNYEERLHYNYPWKVNLQMSMLNNNFDWDDPTNFDELKAASLPKLSVEYYAGKNVSFKLGVLSSEVKAEDLVNGKVAHDKFNVFAVDATMIYSLGGLLNIPIVDPYIETGLGYTKFNKDDKAMFNFGGGLNIWLSDTGLFSVGQYNRDLFINRFGLNFEVLGKKNLSGGPGSNVQINGGVFFVF